MSARNRALRALLTIYKLTLSPALASFGVRCRFTPTCSEYAAQAVETHGALRGAWLTGRRLLRCRPGGGCGHDPVPGRDCDTHEERKAASHA